MENKRTIRLEDIIKVAEEAKLVSGSTMLISKNIMGDDIIDVNSLRLSDGGEIMLLGIDVDKYNLSTKAFKDTDIIVFPPANNPITYKHYGTLEGLKIILELKKKALEENDKESQELENKITDFKADLLALRAIHSRIEKEAADIEERINKLEKEGNACE